MTYRIDCGKSVANTEALKVILKHENVEYETATGAASHFVIIIDLDDYNRVKFALSQWETAINNLLKSL